MSQLTSVSRISKGRSTERPNLKMEMGEGMKRENIMVVNSCSPDSFSVDAVPLELDGKEHFGCERLQL